MTKHVCDRVVVRVKSKNTDITPHLKALAAAGIGKSVSDRMRQGIICLCHKKKVEVSA